MSRDSSEDDEMMLRDAHDWTSLPLDDPATRAAFVKWVRESPATLSAFLRETMLSVELSGLDDGREFDLDAILSAAVQQAPHAASATEDSEI
jgi:hypothetical protein